nr:50S ribosomal protein L18P [uncultured archaeon]
MGAKIQIVNVRRKEKTNYRKRLRVLLARKPRIVIRKSLKHVYVQVVRNMAEGDQVLFTMSSKNLQKLGWKAGQKNLPSAYLTGLMAGKKAKAMGINDAILDLGLNRAVKGAKIFAALKGVVDGGVRVPHSDSILPGEDRISGKHIVQHASNIKGTRVDFKAYAKNNVKPEDLPKLFDEMKNKIMRMQ